MWQHAVDNFDLDPGLRTCKGCDMDFYPTVKFIDGLCPECAREKELAEAAEEELADTQERKPCTDLHHDWRRKKEGGAQ